MQQNVFYSMNSYSLSKHGAYVAHNATSQPTIRLEIQVYYASSS